MKEHCPYCGTELKKTTWNRKFCPNCGIIPENRDEGEEDARYIG